MANINVRGVPDDVYEELKERALAAGQPLEDYVLARIIRITEKPTVAEFNARALEQGLEPDLPNGSVVVAIRRARDAGEELFTDDFYDADATPELIKVDPRQPPTG